MWPGVAQVLVLRRNSRHRTTAQQPLNTTTLSPQEPLPTRCLELCQKRHGMLPRFASKASCKLYKIHPTCVDFRYLLRILCAPDINFTCPHQRNWSGQARVPAPQSLEMNMPQGRRVGPQPRPHALRAALKAIVPLSRRACATQAVSGLRMRARLRIAVCLATSSVWVASETLSKCCKHVSTAIMARPNTKKKKVPTPKWKGWSNQGLRSWPPGLRHLLQQRQGGLPLPALLAGAQSGVEGDDLTVFLPRLLPTASLCSSIRR